MNAEQYFPPICEIVGLARKLNKTWNEQQAVSGTAVKASLECN